MIRVFAVFAITAGIGLIVWPARTLKTLGAVSDPDPVARHRWGLRIVGAAAIATGIRLLAG